MAKTTVYNNVAGLNRTLRSIPKEANVRLRDASQEIAGEIAADAGLKAKAIGGVAALVADSIKARRDRIPKVVMGGAAKLPTEGAGWSRARTGRRQTVGDVIWGAEFGSDRFTQFSPWTGNDTGSGRFLWPTVRALSDRMMDRWSEALRDALRDV